METFKCVKRPVLGEVSPPIDRDNIRDVAKWCHGAIVTPLFAEIDGFEIELQDCITMQTEFARIGDRVVKLADYNFHRVSPDEFERDYAIIPDKANHIGYVELPYQEVRDLWRRRSLNKHQE